MLPIFIIQIGHAQHRCFSNILYSMLELDKYHIYTSESFFFVQISNLQQYGSLNLIFDELSAQYFVIGVFKWIISLYFEKK